MFDNLNSKKWLSVELLYALANAVIINFVSLYIWQTKQDLSPILLYHIALFVGIPIAGLAASYLTEKNRLKYSFAISFLTKALVLFSIIRYPETFINHPLVFGFISALATGFFIMPRNTVFQLLTDDTERGKQTAILNVGLSFIELAIPLLGAFWVFSTGSYNGIFTFAIFILVLSAFFLSRIRLTTGDNIWNIKMALNFHRNPDFFKLALIQYFSGIKNGISWALFDVLTFYLLQGNMSKWGITDSFLNLIGIVGGIVYTKYIAGKLDLPILMLTGLIYTGVNILFVSNFTFASLVTFMAFHYLAQVFLASSISPVVTGMLEEDSRAGELINEYNAILEFPLALGRITPLVVLFIANSSLDYDPVLKIIFLVMGVVPLIIVSILKKTHLFKLQFEGLT